MNHPLLTLAAISALATPAALGQSDAERHTPRPTSPAFALPSVQRAPTHVDRTESPRPTPAPAQRAVDRRIGANPPLEEFTHVATLDRFERVHHDVDVTGTHWSRGRGYKSSANPSGFAFIPFLGSDAPQNYPIHFRLSRATQGSSVFDLRETARVSRRGDRIVLDRGDVEVRYDVTPDGVEQSFAFEKPTGAGDLVLEIAVETELEVSPEGGGFRFSNDRGGATYSAAIAYDAEGHRCDVPATWTEDAIQLAVPAAFVAGAVGRIVVDPVTAPFVVDDFTADLKYPDAAYDLATDQYLVVYQEEFSAGDFDVYSRFVDATTGGTSGGAYIDFTSEDWVRPRVAQQRFERKFLVVATADSVFVAGQRDLVGRFRNGDGTLEPQFVLKAATPSYSCHSPDIGSESLDVSASYYCIAYNRDFGTDDDVWAIVFDTAGNYVGAEIPLATLISADEGAPAVSKSTGSVSGVTRYNVAWRVVDLNSGDHSVHACQVSFSGGTVHGPYEVTPPVSGTEYFDVEVSSLSDLRHPTTADQYYLVTYDDSPSVISDAFVAVCSGTTVHGVQELQVSEHTPRDLNEDNLTVATSREHFFLAYEQSDSLFVTTVQPISDSFGITERRSVSPGSSIHELSLVGAAPFDGGVVRREAAFFWHSFDGMASNIHMARATAAAGDEASGWQYCYGAPNSTGDHGFIALYGDRSVSSFQDLCVEALPQNSFGYFLASMSAGFVPNAGGSQGTLCLSGSIGRFSIFNSGTSGSVCRLINPNHLAQPTGTVSAVAGQVWRFQCWHRDSVGGAATSNFTNAVAIPFL